MLLIDTFLWNRYFYSFLFSLTYNLERNYFSYDIKIATLDSFYEISRWEDIFFSVLVCNI